MSSSEQIISITNVIRSEKLREIAGRLDALYQLDSRPWKFNTAHEMFIGTDNAIEMYDRVVHLGRTSSVWEQSKDPNIRGSVLSAESKRTNEATQALGEFLEHCREDMATLLNEIDRLNSAATAATKVTQPAEDPGYNGTGYNGPS